MLMLFSVVFLFLAVEASADKYAGEFLYVGAGARALAMGSAFAAVSDDISAAYWNPAGLVNARGRMASFMHSERFGGLISYDYLAYSQEYAGDVFAASLFRTDAGDIANTSDLQWYDTGSDGVFGEDGSGEPGDSGNDDWDQSSNQSGTEAHLTTLSTCHGEEASARIFQSAHPQRSYTESSWTTAHGVLELMQL